MNTIIDKEWDVIVIGTGVGGSTTGYALAQKGFKVLFIEKGIEVQATNNDEISEDPNLRIEQGWWPYPISEQKGKNQFNRFFAPIGCGLAGSSMHYAAALERMEPSDFESITIDNQTHDAWPISYKEFLAYYEKAEAVYGLNEDTDEKWQSRLSEWDKAFIKALQTSGLNPERLKVGIKYDDDCKECIGKVCHRSCKQDAKTACLDKVRQLNNTQILQNCEVLSINANQTMVESISIRYQESTHSLKAKCYVLAAGALHTPKLLLQSSNKDWPNGLANRSNMVGKNLMFHGSDIYAIWAPKKYVFTSIQKKSIAIKDFCYLNDEPLGHIQSMGLSAGRGLISIFLKDQLKKIGIHNNKILSLITFIPSHFGAWLFGEATIFSAQIEDFPSTENKISLNNSEPNGMSFTYTITTDLKARAKKLKKLFSSHLKNWRVISIIPSGVQINPGHACGTCKMGRDPKTSVLNADCRAHDITNLYISDASFMPRSGSANPSLTIAANGLRVADKIAESLLKN